MEKIFFLIFISFCHAAQAENHLYRVIQTPPNEFIYALKAQSVSIREPKTADSRLQKFFKLSSKKVTDSDIEMKVQAKADMLPAALIKHTGFTIRLHELKGGAPHVFRTEFIFGADMGIEGLMKISAFEQATLIEFDVQHTTVPLWLLDKAIQIIFKLNLASATPKNTK